MSALAAWPAPKTAIFHAFEWKTSKYILTIPPQDVLTSFFQGLFDKRCFKGLIFEQAFGFVDRFEFHFSAADGAVTQTLLEWLTFCFHYLVGNCQ